MFLILFRSLKLAIIGILPNLLGAGVVLGVMGWAGIPMDMMTITIAAITIGIAVDNGIHYIYRFKEEYAISKNYVETMRICHSNIGRAVFYTTITIVVGFAILVFSNFNPTIYFGVLIAAAMLIALLAALHRGGTQRAIQVPMQIGQGNGEVERGHVPIGRRSTATASEAHSVRISPARGTRSSRTFPGGRAALRAALPSLASPRRS